MEEHGLDLVATSALLSVRTEEQFDRHLTDAALGIGFTHVSFAMEWRRHELPPLRYVTCSRRPGTPAAGSCPICRENPGPGASLAGPQEFRFSDGHGVAISVPESTLVRSMLSLSREDSAPNDVDRDEVISAATVLANCAHLTMKRLLVPRYRAELTATLTRQENECLRWVALGKSSPVIGEILGVSQNTVEFHLKNVFRKLDVSTRTQAAIVAFELNLV